MNRRLFSYGLFASLLGTRVTHVGAQTPAPADDVPQVQPIASPDDPGAYIGALLGNPDAQARMLIYSDTQCQYCQIFHQDWLPLLITDYVEPGVLLLEYREHPTLGRGGLSALVNTSSFEAQALLAAGEQQAYFQMLQAMMSRTHVWSGDVIATAMSMATEIGIDADTLAARLDERWFVPVLHEAVQDGRKRGVTGTPAFQIGPINDRAAMLAADLLTMPFSGYEVFRQDIDEELAKIN